MSQKSSIEWTDATLNISRGCTKISSGCAHCYAERFAERFRGVSGHPFEDGFDIKLAPHRLLDPVRWVKSRRIFVNSMSDIFHSQIPSNYLDVFAQVMYFAHWHTYFILTKRSKRLVEELESGHILGLRMDGFSHHVWWGVSVEDRRSARDRISDLRKSLVKNRFISIEPLIEDLGELNLQGIDWVIVGGESGPNARPIDPKWIESILEQCRSAHIPFFFKQWGGVQKSRAGRLLHGRTFDELPDFYRGGLRMKHERINFLDSMKKIIDSKDFQIIETKKVSQ